MSTALSDEDRFLAIETSCDDTCAAVLRGDGKILSNVVSSQAIHASFEGVVPELASREHLALFLPVLRRALSESDTKLEDLHAVAVTRGPGLIGCLLVGLAAAKGLAMSLDVPLLGVNHIEGHLHAIEGVRPLEPPFVALVASGGHTELMFATSWKRFELLGATLDDAAGEAFDKVAKLLGLGFPGGPVVDRLAREGNPTAFAFPRAWLGLDSGGLDVSFSGLKTAVKLAIERHGMPAEGPDRDRFIRDVCASFQAAVVDVLVAKMEAAARRTGAKRLLLSGGVACNSALRAGTAALAERLGGEAHWPTPLLCSDNAGMIGLAALPRLRAGEHDAFDLAAVANLDDLSFGEATR